MGGGTGNSDAKTSIRHLKVAVALACIRSKPNGLSARQYAEQLCARYRAEESRWKQKYEQAEMTILKLKQTQELQSYINFSGLVDLIPFITFDVNSSQNQNDEEPMEVDRDAEHIKHNTDFIKSYLMLKQANRETSQKSTLGSAVHSTLSSSLYLISKSVENEVLSIPIITDYFQVISQLSSAMEKNFPCLEVQELVQIIIDRALRGDKLERKQRRELILTLKHLLIPQMRDHILDSLLAAIESFSTHLRTVSQNKTPLNTMLYENIYYIFDMLQIVLKDLKDECSGITSGEVNPSQRSLSSDQRLQTASILSEVTERLDKCVLYISDSFPLFVCKIWLIKCNFL
ncbi:meiosis-specific protein MEI4-like [Saccostrea echinata]|uniref:meiosis-specific protein MEI4-like n=1 Tax=Saccostrea echinata TaxID=191078 RepID=UPI002A81B341|nr:meiosis-specific protein MEI4-like [Saccostrea echinata]